VRIVAGPNDDSPWAGAVIVNGPLTGDEPLTLVTGIWNVPTFNIPNGVSGFYTFSMSSWVGIDGVGTPGLAQAGITQMITPSTFAGLLLGDNSSTFAWVEWWPGDAVPINLPVNVGDTVWCTLLMTSSTTVSVWFGNVTQNVSIALEISAPNQDAAISGQTIEWIVENNVIPGANPDYLPQFGDVTFFDCSGWTSGAWSKTVDIDNAQEITMLDPNGNVMAEAAALSDDSLDVWWVNYA
jgi:hypothetical protein